MVDSLPGPLSGLVVADFSRVLAGPLATMILADLGADVVKVERPGSGDETRSWIPPAAADGSSTYFLAVNRNKRSIVLDLSTSDGQAAAFDLASRADILVENFTPGTMDRYGLSYADVCAANPRLIYASLSGFGRLGGAAMPGYDFVVQAVGGLMSITGDPAGDPTKVGVALVDVLAGQHLVTGILAALYHRQHTGFGQLVDVDLLSSLLFGLANQASAYLNADIVPGRLGNVHPSIAPYQTVRTADRPIALAVGNDVAFQRLAHAVGLPEDERFRTNEGRVRHRAALIDELERLLVAQPAANWVSRLTAAGIACGEINSIAEGFALAESLGLNPVVRLPTATGGVAASVANPIRLSRTPVSYRQAPPNLPTS